MAQELADTYAPIMMLKAQGAPCDPAGESFEPISVDIVLGNPEAFDRPLDSLGLGPVTVLEPHTFGE